MNEKKQFPRQQATFVVDGLATVAGSLMGTSPIATYIESAAGIREGGRTGITALTCAFYFFIALFFVPVLCECSARCMCLVYRRGSVLRMHRVRLLLGPFPCAQLAHACAVPVCHGIRS